MRIIADGNVPEEHVRALHGAGHTGVRSREIAELGTGATDEALVRYAEEEALAVFSADVKDFSRVDARVPVLVAPQEMTGGAVRRAVERLESRGADLSRTGPAWLSTLTD